MGQNLKWKGCPHGNWSTRRINPPCSMFFFPFLLWKPSQSLAVLLSPFTLWETLLLKSQASWCGILQVTEFDRRRRLLFQWLWYRPGEDIDLGMRGHPKNVQLKLCWDWVLFKLQKFWISDRWDPAVPITLRKVLEGCLRESDTEEKRACWR